MTTCVPLAGRWSSTPAKRRNRPPSRSAVAALESPGRVRTAADFDAPGLRRRCTDGGDFATACWRAHNSATGRKPRRRGYELCTGGRVTRQPERSKGPTAGPGDELCTPGGHTTRQPAGSKGPALAGPASGRARRRGATGRRWLARRGAGPPAGSNGPAGATGRRGARGRRWPAPAWSEGPAPAGPAWRPGPPAAARRRGGRRPAAGGRTNRRSVPPVGVNGDGLTRPARRSSGPGRGPR